MRAAGAAKSKEQYEQGAQQLQATVTEFKSELDDLDTPDGADDEQEELTKALTDFSGTVGRINSAVQSSDNDAIKAEIATLTPQAAKLDGAYKELAAVVE
jgi:hypothetical protein